MLIRARPPATIQSDSVFPCFRGFVRGHECSVTVQLQRDQGRRWYPVHRVAVDLSELGWDARWAEAFRPHEADGLVPARIAIEFNHIYRAAAAQGDVQVQLAGRLKHAAAGRHELPAVGDWVALRLSPGDDTGTIEALLPRRTRFSRKVAGDTTEEQVVAANIDTVFLVMGLDGDFNPRRLERYLLVAHDSGARAVVLLSKADLADDREAAARAIEALAPGTAGASDQRARAGRRRDRRRSTSAPGAPGRCWDRRASASPR